MGVELEIACVGDESGKIKPSKSSPSISSISSRVSSWLLLVVVPSYPSSSDKDGDRDIRDMGLAPLFFLFILLSLALALLIFFVWSSAGSDVRIVYELVGLVVVVLVLLLLTKLLIVGRRLRVKNRCLFGAGRESEFCGSL